MLPIASRRCATFAGTGAAASCSSPSLSLPSSRTIAEPIATFRGRLLCGGALPASPCQVALRLSEAPLAAGAIEILAAASAAATRLSSHATSDVIPLPRGGCRRGQARGTMVPSFLVSRRVAPYGRRARVGGGYSVERRRLFLERAGWGVGWRESLRRPARWSVSVGCSVSCRGFVGRVARSPGALHLDLHDSCRFHLSRVFVPAVVTVHSGGRVSASPLTRLLWARPRLTLCLSRISSRSSRSLRYVSERACLREAPPAYVRHAPQAKDPHKVPEERWRRPHARQAVPYVTAARHRGLMLRECPGIPTLA